MIDESAVLEIADRLVRVPSIVGVVLGGSRARGTHTPESDVDLGLYYRGDLDVDALADLARRVAGPGAAVTRPGEWGPWVDGGGWLRIDGTDVDWIYRDLDRVLAAWERVRRGHFDFHPQAGHPLGVPDFAYPGELALGRILADPAGSLAEAQSATRRYPAALRSALVGRLWEAGFLVAAARKAVARADVTYVAACLSRALLLACHALHGRAGVWLINEKGAVAASGLLPGAPPEFSGRAQAVLAGLGEDADALDLAIETAGALVAEVERTCRDGGE